MISITKTVTNKDLLTVAEARTQCRIDENDPDITAIDAELQQTIYDAIDIASRDIAADIAYTDVVYTDTDWSGRYVTIKEGNLASITSVKLDDVAIAAADYEYEVHHGYFIIDLKESKAGKLEVQFKTGYADANALPGGLRRALLVKVHDLYDPERASYLPGSMRAQKTYDYLLNSFKRTYY